MPEEKGGLHELGKWGHGLHSRKISSPHVFHHLLLGGFIGFILSPLLLPLLEVRESSVAVLSEMCTIAFNFKSSSPAELSQIQGPCRAFLELR